MKRLLAALGIAFFFAPAAAFMAGERAEPIENRPLAALPSLSRGFNAFDDLTQWGVDHMPLRDSAVRLHTRLSRELLGEAPTLGRIGVPVGVGEAPALAGEPAPRDDPISGNSVVVGRDGIASPCIPVPTFVTSPGSITADMSCPPAVPMHLCNSSRTAPAPWDCFEGGGAI